MLSNGFFSHRRFRPTSAVILPPTSEHVKVTKSSSLPYGYHRTRQHLAIDTDPNTPSLKRFTNLTNGETTRLQQKLLLENAVICDVTLRPRNAGEKKSREERGSGESDFTSFSSSTTLSSNSPVSRPASWTLPGDGNWTLKRHTVIDSNSEFAFMSDGGTDPITFAVDSPRSSSNDTQTAFDTPSTPQPCTPPILTLSHYLNDYRSHHFDDTCCVCAPHTHRSSHSNSFRTVIEEETVFDKETVPDGPPTSPGLPELADHRSATVIDRSISSCSSVASSAAETRRSDRYKSCPDLIRPCILNVDSGGDCFLTPSYGTLNVARRKRSRLNRRTTTPAIPDESMDSKNRVPGSGVSGIPENPLRKWALDDILLWLAKIGLEEVSSILIGYELSGSDLETWDEHILLSYGITDQSTRTRLLTAVQDLQAQQKPQLSPPANADSRLLSRKWSRSSGGGRSNSQSFISLYDVIKRSKHNEIIAIDLPDDVQPSRAFTVAGQPGGGLVVSGCRNTQIPLQIGDIILEFNGENCLPLAAVDFHVLTCQSNKNNRLVVLRKSERGASASTDIGSQTSQCSIDNLPADHEIGGQQKLDDDEEFCLRL